MIYWASEYHQGPYEWDDSLYAITQVGAKTGTKYLRKEQDRSTNSSLQEIGDNPINTSCAHIVVVI